MTPQHIDSQDMLFQELARIKADRMRKGGDKVYITPYIGRNVISVCDELNLNVLFVITEKEN